MKRLAIISLLTLSISLTGCTGLLNLLSSNGSSNVKFEEKGEKMSRSTWMEKFNKTLKNSNLNTDDDIKSFQINATTKIKNTREENNHGKYTNESSGTGKATYQYDADNYLYSYKSNAQTQVTSTSPYGKDTEKGTQNVGEFYQVKNSSLYSIDTVAKTYTTQSTDQTAKEIMNDRASSSINGILLVFALFPSLDTKEQYEYYQNDEIFTIYSIVKNEKEDINATDDSSKIVGSKVTTNEMTFQLNLTSGKNSFKYSIKSESHTDFKEDDPSRGYQAGDTVKVTESTTYVADIKFQAQKMSAMSLSGYTKLS